MWISYVPSGTYKIQSKQFKIEERESKTVLWNYIYTSILKNNLLIEQVIEETNQQYNYTQIIRHINATLYTLRFQGMNRTELNLMKEKGHKIACHSYSHFILSSLTDEQLELDFNRCEQFKDEYNSTFYSYPFGGRAEVSDREIKFTKQKGYSNAFVNHENQTANPHQINRKSLGNLTNKYKIEAKISGFEQLIKRTLGLS